MSAEQPNENVGREPLKEALTPEELRRQKDREYSKEYYRNNKEKVNAKNREYYLRNRDKIREYRREYYQKNRERIRAKQWECYHSDPEYRKRAKKRWEKRREALRKLKIMLGGKCSVCGENDLDILTFHHQDGKEEKCRFIKTKEFKDWVNYGIIPKIALVCANHHLKLHIKKARGELATL